MWPLDLEFGYWLLESFRKVTRVNLVWKFLLHDPKNRQNNKMKKWFFAYFPNLPLSLPTRLENFTHPQNHFQSSQRVSPELDAKLDLQTPRSRKPADLATPRSRKHETDSSKILSCRLLSGVLASCHMPIKIWHVGLARGTKNRHVGIVSILTI